MIKNDECLDKKRKKEREKCIRKVYALYVFICVVVMLLLCKKYVLN